jgi:flagellar biogenesis protein FliO
MGLVQWRWLVAGMLAALLCAPGLLLITPEASLGLVARAAETASKEKAKDSKGAKKKPKVDDTKVADKQQEELPLIDLSAGDPAATSAENVAEDLGAGVTATSKAGADKAAKPAESDTLPFASDRFLLKDRQAGLSLEAIADPGGSVPLIQPKPKTAKKPTATKAPTSKTTAAKSAKKQSAPKPSVKPAVKPAVKPTALASAPPRIELPETAAGESDMVTPAEQEIMPAEAGSPNEWGATNNGPQRPAPGASSQTLKQYWSEDELASEQTDSTLLEDAPAGGVTTETATDTHSDLYAGVIATHGGAGGAAPPPSSPSIGEALRDTKNNTIGSSLPAFNPWRSGSMVLLCLSLGFAALWAAGKFKGSLPGANKRSLAVIESITVAPGRQIAIVEMHGDALVLGITPQSINLLDKLPLERFSMDYSSTVQTIINREASALPGEWAKRPAFLTGTQPPPLAPAPPHRALVPPPRERISVGELRRSRGLSTGAGAPPPVKAMTYTSRGVPYAPPVSVTGTGERVSKDEMISRLRSQLGKLEG